MRIGISPDARAKACIGPLRLRLRRLGRRRAVEGSTPIRRASSMRLGRTRPLVRLDALGLVSAPACIAVLRTKALPMLRAVEMA